VRGGVELQALDKRHRPVGKSHATVTTTALRCTTESRLFGEPGPIVWRNKVLGVYSLVSISS
jgi:hypothetical protein